MENNSNSINNKTTDINITITKKVTIPDFSTMLKNAVVQFNTAKEITQLCDKEIEVLCQEKEDMIAEYCKALFVPIFELEEEAIKNLFGGRVRKQWNDMFKGVTYFVLVTYHDSLFEITFGWDSNRTYILKLAKDGKTRATQIFTLNFLENWKEYKYLLKEALKEKILHNTEFALKQAKTRAEQVDILKNFEL